MNNQNIVLVDPDDNAIGEIEKVRGHQFGMLHRAFSVFIFRVFKDKLQTLIQLRHKQKYHGGGLWSNTCCSHPHPGENLKAAAEKRLQEEIGIDAKLQEVGMFHYIAKMDNGMTENENDHVFIGYLDSEEAHFNTDEVEKTAWVDVVPLFEAIDRNPHHYTPWLKEALTIAYDAVKTK